MTEGKQEDEDEEEQSLMQLDAGHHRSETAKLSVTQNFARLFSKNRFEAHFFVYSLLKASEEKKKKLASSFFGWALIIFLNIFV